MPRLLTSLLLCPLVCCAVTATAADSQSDWPTFRGPERTGVAPDENLLDEWPEDGPELVWKTEGLGRGYASPAVAGGRIYSLGDGLSTEDNADEYLVCLTQADGKELWRQKTGPAWDKHKQESWQSSRSTPTVDGDRVYVITAYGKLICFDSSGSQLWQRDLKEDFDGQKADSWGYSESVLIDGDRLICTPGGPENTMVALDKKTGEEVWSCSRPEDRGAGHASAVISHVDGEKVYVQTTGSGAMGVRAKDGELLWEYEIPRTTAVIPTPIVKDHLVFFTAGYGLGGALLRQVPKDSGEIEIEEVYPNQPDLQNKHGGVVLVDGYLYGDSGDQGIPFCAELETGEVIWKSRGSGRKSASVVAADGKLFFHYQDGTMTMVEASPEDFNELGNFEVPGTGDRPSWAHPVIADGKLYLREDDTLLVYNLKKS